MLKAALLIVFLCPWILGISGCPNAFSEFADKESDEALLYSARMQINAGNYTDAIAAIDQMTTKGQNSRDGRVTKASALAGRCGLNLINLAGDIANGIAGQKLFELLLSSFRATTSATAWVDCKDAEQAMIGIEADEWTSDDYVFLAFVEFAKAGTLLAGATGADVDGDGVVDGGFDSCANDAANIEQDKVAELGIALTISMRSLSLAGSAIAGGATASFTAMCGALPPGFCDQLSTQDFDDDEKLALRGLLKSNEIGLAQCGPYNPPTSCFCAP